ncbi:DNA polymerase III subunit delta [Chloroflexota bacterium]
MKTDAIMFYIMYGKDDFSLHEELNKIKTGLGSPEMLAINTNVLDGRQLTLSQLQDVCNAVPFLHEVRLVIIDGLLARFDPEKKQGKRTTIAKSSKSNTELNEWHELSSCVDKMPVTTVLVIIDGELDEKRNSLLKHLNPRAEVRKFLQPKGENLRRWIKTRIAQGNGKASQEAIDLLDKLVGNDLWNMSGEIEKLLAFSQGRIITEEDVKQITSYTRESNIFALVDAILEGRRKDAQQLLHRLLIEGVAPTHILSMITRQLGLILMTKELDPKMSRQEAMGKLGIYMEFVFDKLLRQVKIHSAEDINRAYHEVLDADMAIKTGKYDGDLSLELLVVNLCEI